MMCFGQKKTHNNITENQTKTSLPESGIEPGTFCIPVGRVTTGPPRQLKVFIVVKLFNCFNAIGQNANNQIRNCGPHIFNKFIFLYFKVHG